METSFICDDDVPETVRQKVHLLYAKEADMRTLQVQMDALRKEIDFLHVELSRYSVMEYSDQEQASHQPVRYTKRGAPIHQCPDEVLGILFSHYLDENHMDICSLLLVCKRWNHLVMNSPTLWACIEISDGRHLFDIPAHSSKQVYTYIAACLKRSNELPIDVKLDFDNIPDSEESWITNVIYRSKIGYSRNVTNLICNSDGDLGTDYDDEVRKVFEQFASPKGANPERWATLSITVPTDANFSPYMWSLFLPAAPRLKAVRMVYGEARWNANNAKDLIIPEFLAASSLRFPYNSLNDFKASPMHLRHLEIGIIREYHTLADLSLFQLLESLILRVKVCDYDPDFIPFRIHLPLLKDLCLSGNYTFLKPFNLDFPILSGLSLHNDSRRWFEPDSSPLNLQWGKIKVPSYAKYCEPLLFDFLPRFPTVQVLTLSHVAEEAVLKAITDWKVEGKIPNLRQLQFTHSYEMPRYHYVSN